MRIADALVDTGSAFSMLSTAMYGRIPDAPAIQPFTGSALDIIGVGSATAEICRYVDAPIKIDDTAVRHPLLVVEGLAFPLLLGTDILRPRGAMLTLDESVPLRLRTRVCGICREQRTDLLSEPPSAPLTACAASKAVIEPCTAAFIRVRMPRALRDVFIVAVEPLASLLEDKGCAVLPSVLASIDSVCYVAVANPFNRRVEIPANVPVAAVAPVAMAHNSPSTTAAVAHKLSLNEKLREVLRELHVDTLPDSTPHKRPLISLMCKYIDVFAENDSDVGTTNLTFHEIDTADTRPLRQPVRRLPYGKVREAIANEIEKMTNAGIARPSTSPWASPVVMVRKKDGGWRMCIDYRRLNSITKFDCFPLPRLDAKLDAFSGSTYSVRWSWRWPIIRST